MSTESPTPYLSHDAHHAKVLDDATQMLTAKPKSQFAPWNWCTNLPTKPWLWKWNELKMDVHTHKNQACLPYISCWCWNATLEVKILCNDGNSPCPSLLPLGQSYHCPSAASQQLCPNNSMSTDPSFLTCHAEYIFIQDMNSEANSLASILTMMEVYSLHHKTFVATMTQL